MAIEYDLKEIEKKLQSLKTRESKLNYLNEYLFSIKKKLAEFVATDSTKLDRLKEKTKDDFDKYHAEFDRGGLIYFNGDNSDEWQYKRLGFTNIPLLRKRLHLENTKKQLEGDILLFEGLIQKVKQEARESESYQPDLKIELDSDSVEANNDFGTIYYEIRFKSGTPYLQSKLKDAIERLLKKHSGYKRQIYTRLRFAINDWIIYQRREGNFIDDMGNRVKGAYQNAIGTENILTWLCEAFTEDGENIPPRLPPAKTFNSIENLDKMLFAYQAFLPNCEGNFNNHKALYKLCEQFEKYDIINISHRAFQELKKLCFTPNNDPRHPINYYSKIMRELIYKAENQITLNNLNSVDIMPKIQFYFQAIQPLFDFSTQLSELINSMPESFPPKEQPNKLKETEKSKTNKPKVLLDIWLPDKNDNKEASYQRCISFLKTENSAIGIAFVTEVNGQLHWNKVPQRGWVQFLAGFYYTCIKKRWIRDSYSAQQIKNILKKTFDIDFNAEPFKQITANPPEDKYCRPFSRLPANLP